MNTVTWCILSWIHVVTVIKYKQTTQEISMISNTVLDYICDQLIKTTCMIIILRNSKL